MTKQQKLDLLKDKLVSANPVPELADGARQIVFGSGNTDADIVFVGEAPGKKEDELGMPFVGASGKFLDEMLAHTGLNRHDVYITNIVKFRPPENRDPTPAEKEAFWPYLLEEILIIKPKIIATLGRHSGQAFIKSLRIGVDHGQPQTVKLSELIERKQLDDTVNEQNDLTVTIVPLYHPAAALYNGSLRQTLLDDFTIVNKIIK
jgi:DNA polymerase